MEDLALIILNYNSADDTIICVNQILSFKMATHIIVVDNMSTDDSYDRICNEFAKEKSIEILKAKKNRGYSAGNNFGMKYAIEKYGVSVVGILNPDVIIPEEAVLKRMYKVLKSEERAAIIGAIQIDASNIYNLNSSAWDIPSKKEIIFNHFLINTRKSKAQNFKLVGSKLAQVECVAGCFFLAKVSSMKKIGFLDENIFLYNEENILGIKCKKENFIELLVLDQFYIHNHMREKNKNMPFKKKIMATNYGYQSRKYLCMRYYSKMLIPFLWIVERLNRVFLAVCYLKNKFIY